MSGVPRMSAFSLSCACLRNVTAISPVSVGQDAEELLVARRDPRVELRRAPRAVGQVEVEEHVGDGAGVEPAPRAAARPARGRNAE